MIGILDLQLGNLNSVYNAVYEIGFDPVIINKISSFDDITHLILPGVGHFKAAMEHYYASGLSDSIIDFVSSNRPLLGICLGMQLLAKKSMEGGETSGLSFIEGEVVRFDSEQGLSVPHVGWNTVHFTRPHPVFNDIKQDRDYYFVHSYHYSAASHQAVLGQTEYGGTFPSIVGQNNVIGFQFHPEKSQKNGLQLLENFCHWDGKC